MVRAAPHAQGATSVLGWAAGASPGCRLGPCCHAPEGVWGVHWHGAQGAVAGVPRSCASCPCCWWHWALRGLGARAAASGAARGGRPGCCLCHPEDVHWLQTLVALERQLENWGCAGLVSRPGSLGHPWLPRAAALGPLLGRDLPWAAGEQLHSRSRHRFLWASPGWEHSGH